MTYGLAALTVGISSLPLLFILWRVVKAPIRIGVPLLFFLGLIVLIQDVSALIGPEGGGVLDDILMPASSMPS
jgi:hypothetical protein